MSIDSITPCPRYTVYNEVLGEGVNGVVYAARDNITGSPVAAKVGRPNHRKAAAKEVRSWSLINSHPSARHFLHMRYYFPTAISGYIFTDLIQKTLEDLLRENYLFTLGEISVIGSQAFETLHDLKLKKLVHGDIKPDNIAFNWGSLQVHLIDPEFVQEEAEKMSTRVQAECFRAPEVFLQVPQFDISVDAWSLGCTLYELYTGASFIPRGRPPDAEIFSYLVARIGMPSEDYLRRMPAEHVRKYFSVKDGANDAYLPQISSWREEIEQARQRRGDYLNDVNPLINLLDRIFRYENRITFDEAFRHPFLCQHISIRIEVPDPSWRSKDLLFMDRNSYFRDASTAAPIHCVRIPMNSRPLDCVHLPRVDQYIIGLVDRDAPVPRDLQDWPITLRDRQTFIPVAYPHHLASSPSTATYISPDTAHSPPASLPFPPPPFHLLYPFHPPLPAPLPVDHALYLQSPPPHTFAPIDPSSAPNPPPF